MKLNCTDVEEAIWNSAREGIELDEQHLLHIEQCKSCAEALVEASASVEALGQFKQCPPSPDCRQHVMSKISPKGRKRHTRLAWAFVPAALAAVLTVILCNGNLEKHAKKQIDDSPIASSVSAHQIPQKPKITCAEVPKLKRIERIDIRTARKSGCATSLHARRKRPRPITINHRPTEAIAKNAESLDSQSMATAPADSSSIDEVSFVWGPNSGDGEISYQYTEVNTATGTATVQTVRQIGNSIDVRVEDVPVESMPSSKVIDNADYLNA